MTSDHKQLVWESWAHVAPMAEVAATLFYNRLLELDPELHDIFVSTDKLFAKSDLHEQSDLHKQSNLLMQTLSFAVKGLETPQQLLPAVEQLGKRSVHYGVKESHYNTVGAALLWTLEQCLYEGFTPEVREAWTESYSLLSTVMMIGARGRYEPLLR
jgi:hemoglobin-like flavoprotein